MRVTIMCLSHFVCLLLLLIKRNDIIFNFCNFVWCSSKCTASSPDLLKDSHNFLTLRQATFLTILYLWTRYTILIHRDRQLSWQFHLFEQVMSFLHWGKFPDNLMSWTRNTIFIRWMFFIFRVPFKKRRVPIDTACFPWTETTTIWKSPKKQPMQKLCHSDNIVVLFTLLPKIWRLGNKYKPTMLTIQSIIMV